MEVHDRARIVSGEAQVMILREWRRRQEASVAGLSREAQLGYWRRQTLLLDDLQDVAELRLDLFMELAERRGVFDPVDQAPMFAIDVLPFEPGVSLFEGTN